MSYTSFSFILLSSLPPFSLPSSSLFPYLPLFLSLSLSPFLLLSLSIYTGCLAGARPCTSRETPSAFLPLTPPTLRKVRTKEWHQKPGSSFLAAEAARLSDMACPSQCPPRGLASDHTWAQSQLLGDTLLPPHLRSRKPPHLNPGTCVTSLALLNVPKSNVK